MRMRKVSNNKPKNTQPLYHYANCSGLDGRNSHYNSARTDIYDNPKWHSFVWGTMGGGGSTKSNGATQALAALCLCVRQQSACTGRAEVGVKARALGQEA